MGREEPSGRSVGLRHGHLQDFSDSLRRGILGSSWLQAGADLGSKAAARSAHYPCPPELRASSWDLWRMIVTSSGDLLRSNFPRISRKSGTYLI
jgi:hypothetical protein